MPGSAALNCLVTGGAGFIGSNLVERLVSLGHPVRVVDNLSTGDEANISGVASDIDFMVGDLCEPDVCRRAVTGMDVVFHVAALPSVPRSLKDPWASHDANVNATMRLLEACREARVRRIIYSSSSSVYGATPCKSTMRLAAGCAGTRSAWSTASHGGRLLRGARRGLTPLGRDADSHYRSVSRNHSGRSGQAIPRSRIQAFGSA